MIAAGLLAYAALLLTACAPALARAAWPDRAPGLAMVAWLALCGSAIAAVVLGGTALLVPVIHVNMGAGWLLHACEMALHAKHAGPGGAVLAGAGAVLAIAVAARTTCSAGAFLAANARAARAHGDRLRLAGRPVTRLGALVVDHDEPGAYCMPGTRSPVVLTTAALRALDDAQLGAVLAHERAHQSGRHHLLVALAAVPAVAFPRVPAFRLARDQVARLAELAADDAAARRSPRLTVAEALLTLGTAPDTERARGPVPSTAGVLGASGATAAARIRRLIAAPAPLSRAASTGGATAVAALAAMPLVLAATAVLNCCSQPG